MTVNVRACQALLRLMVCEEKIHIALQQVTGLTNSIKYKVNLMSEFNDKDGKGRHTQGESEGSNHCQICATMSRFLVNV